MKGASEADWVREGGRGTGNEGEGMGGAEEQEVGWGVKTGKREGRGGHGK